MPDNDNIPNPSTDDDNESHASNSNQVQKLCLKECEKILKAYHHLTLKKLAENFDIDLASAKQDRSKRGRGKRKDIISLLAKTIVELEWTEITLIEKLTDTNLTDKLYASVASANKNTEANEIMVSVIKTVQDQNKQIVDQQEKNDKRLAEQQKLNNERIAEQQKQNEKKDEMMLNLMNEMVNQNKRNDRKDEHMMALMGSLTNKLNQPQLQQNHYQYQQQAISNIPTSSSTSNYDYYHQKAQYSENSELKQYNKDWQNYYRNPSTPSYSDYGDHKKNRTVVEKTRASKPIYSKPVYSSTSKESIIKSVNASVRSKTPESQVLNRRDQISSKRNNNQEKEDKNNNNQKAKKYRRENDDNEQKSRRKYERHSESSNGSVKYK